MAANARPGGSTASNLVSSEGAWRPSGSVKARQGGGGGGGCGGRIAPFPIGYHHVLPKAKWPTLADNSLNIVGVTADCHANHETRAKPLTLAAVAVLADRPLTDRQ